MTPRVTRRAAARADLAEIWDYIAQDDPERATTFLSSLESVFETLANQPMMGRERSELGENVRSFPAGRYAIYYQPYLLPAVAPWCGRGARAPRTS